MNNNLTDNLIRLCNKSVSELETILLGLTEGVKGMEFKTISTETK